MLECAPRYHAPSRSIYCPRSSVPRHPRPRRLHFRFLCPATRAPDGSRRPPLGKHVDRGPAVSVHHSPGPRLHASDRRSCRRAHRPRSSFRGQRNRGAARFRYRLAAPALADRPGRVGRHRRNAPDHVLAHPDSSSHRRTPSAGAAFLPGPICRPTPRIRRALSAVHIIRARCGSCSDSLAWSFSGIVGRRDLKPHPPIRRPLPTVRGDDCRRRSNYYQSRAAPDRTTPGERQHSRIRSARSRSIQRHHVRRNGYPCGPFRRQFAVESQRAVRGGKVSPRAPRRQWARMASLSRRIPAPHCVPGRLLGLCASRRAHGRAPAPRRPRRGADPDARLGRRLLFSFCVRRSHGRAGPNFSVGRRVGGQHRGFRHRLVPAGSRRKHSQAESRGSLARIALVALAKGRAGFGVQRFRSRGAALRWAFARHWLPAAPWRFRCSSTFICSSNFFTTSSFCSRRL